jgi:hypothetical protein
MKKMVLILVLFLVLAGCNQSKDQTQAKDQSRIPPSGVEERQSQQRVVEVKDWYFVSVQTGKCTELYGGTKWKTPADCIKDFQEAKMPYKVIDDKVKNGKVVQLRVVNLDENTFFTFYYGVDRCEEALKAKKTKQEKELEKYK